MKLNLPPALLDAIKSGQAILFLGAGASKGAMGKSGQELPIGNELGQKLSEKFLGGKFNDKDLAFISSLAGSETHIFKVQEYIKELFTGFKPSSNHLLIPSFKWKAIFTTNYDTIIEESYKIAAKNAVQELIPLKSNEEVFDNILGDFKKIALFKLHGCITRVRDANCLLILTTEQYNNYRKGRDHLFDQFDAWAQEYPIIFIGHGLQDSDIRATLSRLDSLVDRPRSYLISRQKQDEEKRFWETKKITAIDGTFDDFIETINIEIPSQFRAIYAKISTDQPIERRFVDNKKMSRDCATFLENDVDFVHASLKTETHPVDAFYRGFDLGWFGIEKKLDIKRDLQDTLLWSLILQGEETRPSKCDFYVIKAPAGDGKTVFLRRLAWETAIEANMLALFLKETGTLKYDCLFEIYNLTKERIFLFVNNASDRVHDLSEIIIRARREKLPITIITTERFNEWNVSCEPLDKLLSGFYELQYLNRREIIDLLAKLEEHDLLNHLKGLTPEERISSLEKRSGRQLLVALHEVTLGKRFEDIIVDEYNEIKPKLAQSIYLTICTLNRYRIPVRAGLISRIYGISFSDFKMKFFGPLEKVVYASEDKIYGDYGYKSRHPQIAEIVFQRILSRSEDKFAEYSTLLQALNISYSVDFTAFKKLLNAKALLEIFSDHNSIQELYKIGDKIEPSSSYLFHQRGVYEMNRDNGSLAKAGDFLLKGRNLNKKDTTILHSLAELAFKRAGVAVTDLEKEKFRREAEQICGTLLNDPFTKRYARNTIVKIAIDRLEEGLNQQRISDPEIDDLIHDIEKNIEKGLQEYALDSHLLLLESQFRRILKNKEKALSALQKAFNANKRDPFIAIRLSKVLEGNNDVPGAINTLREALDANPSDSKGLHYALAKLLQLHYPQDTDSLLYHFKRAFIPKDTHYDAQFWYGYYSYVKGEAKALEEGKEIFKFLRVAPMPFESRMKIHTYLFKNGEPEIFTGKIKRKSSTFGFVQRDGIGDEIFMHPNSIGDTWSKLNELDSVNFNLGFSYSGPTVLNISV